MAGAIGFAALERLLIPLPAGELYPPGFHRNLLVLALSGDAAAAVPVLAVLPFSGSYVEEVRTKFVRFLCIRSDYRSYLLSRLFVCFLSGAGVILLGLLAAWGAAALVFIPLEAPGTLPAEPLLRQCALLSLSGGLWATLGLAASALMESKYIAYAAPFVLYYLLVIGCERYFPGLGLLSPRQWTADPAGGIWILGLALASAVLFARRAERRLRQL